MYIKEERKKRTRDNEKYRDNYRSNFMLSIGARQGKQKRNEQKQKLAKKNYR